MSAFDLHTTCGVIPMSLFVSPIATRDARRLCAVVGDRRLDFALLSLACHTCSAGHGFLQQHAVTSREAGYIHKAL